MRKPVSVLFLSGVVFLCACDSPPGKENDRQPALPQTGETPDTVIPLPVRTPETPSEAAGAGSAQNVEVPQHKALDLSFDHVLTEPAQDTDSVSGADAGRLLPDLFAPHKDESPLSVEGRLLMEEDAREFSDSLDGAAITIEIKTD